MPDATQEPHQSAKSAPDTPAVVRAVEEVDVAAAQAASNYREKPVVRALGKLGDLADQPPLVAFSLATLAAGLLSRRPTLALAGLRMVAAHAAATGAKAVVKRTVDRTRPHVLVEEGRYETGAGEHNHSDYNSFPSGHTAGAVAVARAVSRTYPRAAPAAGVLAAIAALIQIPRCRHYPSDVTAGALIGWGSEAATSALLGRAGRLLRG